MIRLSGATVLTKRKRFCFLLFPPFPSARDRKRVWADFGTDRGAIATTIPAAFRSKRLSLIWDRANDPDYDATLASQPRLLRLKRLFSPNVLLLLCECLFRIGGRYHVCISWTFISIVCAPGPAASRRAANFCVFAASVIRIEPLSRGR